MVKFVALVLVFGTIFNSLLIVSHAYNNDGNSYKFSDNDEITSVNNFSRDKLTKKYNKDKEKKEFYPGKESNYKQDEHSKGKEPRKKFSSQNNLHEFGKTEKSGKYDSHGNHYNDLWRDKNVNYHDKVGTYEKYKSYKRKRNEQEILDDETLGSLQHDIDVNNINHQTPVSLHGDTDVNYNDHPKKFNPDAELINVEEIAKNHKMKDNYKNLNSKNKKGKGNFYKNLKEIDLTTIPSSNNSALVARFMIHYVDWTVLGTLSTNIKMKGGPFVNVISVSDGPINKGSGVPFFYMTPKDFSSLDLEKDNRSCITVTLAQTDFCKDKRLDPENPLCDRLILYGKVKKIKPGSEEEDFARLALFSRHPEMKTWPADHDWFFSKLKIKQVILINHFGGASYISLQDYFNADSA